MEKFIESLKQNRIFRFLASVQMAVPLMLALAIIVAVATVVESRYNAQLAGMLVYKSWWFEALTALLWVNVFLSTISRLPFKAHHTGFVITHVGLLMLLAGGMITSEFGIDGQLRVVEGQSNNLVSLPQLSLKVANPKDNSIQSYKLKRAVDPLSQDQLGMKALRKNVGLVVERYLPFAAREQGYVNLAKADANQEVGAVVNFTLHSPMFGQASEWLHSKDRPEAQMGPTLLRLVVDTKVDPPSKAKPGKPVVSAARPMEQAGRAVAAAQSKEGILVVKDAQGKELLRVSVADLQKKPQMVKDIRISLLRKMEQAVVSENQLVDQGQKGINPALVLKLEKGNQTVREVSFAKYPGFSLNGGASLGIQFEYLLEGVVAQSQGAGGPHGMGAPSTAELPQGHPQTGDANAMASAAPSMGESAIEFRVTRGVEGGAPTSIRLNLSKAGKQVFSKVVNVGETIETPWMGMKISVNSVLPNAVARDEVRPVEMRPRSPLPDSAIFVRAENAPSSEGVWLLEGEFKTVQAGNSNVEVFYGMESVELPFSLQLEKFSKIDYPGTETPMSFQSSVKVNSSGDPITISMNEPLKLQGFTLYQSSYEVGPGIPTASIFSVNRDPGRLTKYLGSLILCIGIVLFSLMKSDWYTNNKRRRMNAVAMLLLGVLVVGGMGGASATAYAEEQAAQTQGAADPHAGHNHGPGEGHSSSSMAPVDASTALETFRLFASKIDSGAIQGLPVQSHGRLKPFQTYARESLLYVTGKYRYEKMDAVQLYLALMISNSATSIPLINIRDPELRAELGFSKKDRHFSLQALEMSKLEQMAQPALARQEQNSKSLTPKEKALVETMQQVWLARGIMSGRHLLGALDLTAARQQGEPATAGPVFEKAEAYLRAVSSQDPAAAGKAGELIAAVRAQQMPELFQKNVDKMDIEVWYNNAGLLRWAAFLYLLAAICALIPQVRNRLQGKLLWLVGLPMLLHIGAFAARVYITGFAPVTNMYGTMVWVAFGVVLFGTVLFKIYRNYNFLGYVLIGGALTLFLTESLPLVLSPDLDPIVAVLRSNFWLTTHVLTITISYAAFTICMILGNIALVRATMAGIANRAATESEEKFYAEYGQLNYRAMQIGVFFLTTGIILGGIWADYSWGRFWGWDPKETWSLIADLGFLTILHARYVGWLRNFGVLAAGPVAYLLVIMAWYGVNFILASGLHSYGFSSGGAAAVTGFVGAQLLLLGVALAVHQMRKGKTQTPAKNEA